MIASPFRYFKTMIKSFSFEFFWCHIVRQWCQRQPACRTVSSSPQCCLGVSDWTHLPHVACARPAPCTAWEASGQSGAHCRWHTGLAGGSRYSYTWPQSGTHAVPKTGLSHVLPVASAPNWPHILDPVCRAGLWACFHLRTGPVAFIQPTGPDEFDTFVVRHFFQATNHSSDLSSEPSEIIVNSFARHAVLISQRFCLSKTVLQSTCLDTHAHCTTEYRARMYV